VGAHQGEQGPACSPCTSLSITKEQVDHAGSLVCRLGVWYTVFAFNSLPNPRESPTVSVNWLMSALSSSEYTGLVMPAESAAVWNLPNTNLAGWCLGATEGSTMQNTAVTATCQKMEMRFMTPWGGGAGGGA
jgi:hypothetical protein